VALEEDPSHTKKILAIRRRSQPYEAEGDSNEVQPSPFRPIKDHLREPEIWDTPWLTIVPLPGEMLERMVLRDMDEEEPRNQ